MLLLLLLAVQQDRAEKLYERIRFPEVEEWAEKSDHHRRSLDIVLKKEYWIGAIRAIESKLGPFRDDLVVTVELRDWDGTMPAVGWGDGSKGTVRFNMRRLAEYLEKLDAIEAQRKEFEKAGKRLVYKVPPTKFDRLVYHELTHVLQSGYEAPKWFTEGLASWIGDDPVYLYAFATADKRVGEIDEALEEEDDAYGRGLIFFKWLEQKSGRDALRKLAKETYLDRKPWKESLEKVTGLSWSDLRKEEREWSARRMRGYKPRD